jgi:hypothetical protein
MGELVTFTPRAPAKTVAGRPGLPATIVIFPGVRYERAGEKRQPRAAGQEKGAAADGVKA